MRQPTFVMCFLLMSSLVGTAASQMPSAARPATIDVQPTDDGFQTYIVAAIIKKKVPVNVVDREELASWILKAARVEVHEESTGSKVVKCLFAYCADINDKANTSVQLVNSDGVIVWSYSVNKGRGAKNRQSLAEAIASHPKGEYVHKMSSSPAARSGLTRMICRCTTRSHPEHRDCVCERRATEPDGYCPACHARHAAVAEGRRETASLGGSRDGRQQDAVRPRHADV